MQAVEENRFIDLLEERRKDYDLMWVSRATKPLPPHKLLPELVYSRKQIIEAVLSNYKIRFLLEALAARRNVPVSTITAEAHGMLQEMASKAHLPTVRWLGLIITKVLKRILLSIRLNDDLLHKLKHQMDLYQVQYIYAPTHRSYLDFVLVSYILFSYDMALPNIASGMDFYNMRFVGEILRRTGAFYMRRTFSTDPLYKEIFRAYVNTIMEHSDRAIEFFLEGTRSRSQKSLAPKFGLLSTILDNLYRSTVPDIQFVPVSVSYDKPLEELLFAYELLGVPKPAESTGGLLRGGMSILRQPPGGFGNAYLKIGTPISARDYMDWQTRSSSALYPLSKMPPEITTNVAYAIVDSHKRNTVLTPFNLVALLLNQRILEDKLQSGGYHVEELLREYGWIRRFLHQRLNVAVNPPATNVSSATLLPENEEERDKLEVYESLQTHRDLIQLDSESKLLKLKSRHRCSDVQDPKDDKDRLSKVKGHHLSEETMRIAVPAINLSIYVNPVFAHLTKLSLVSISSLPSSADKGFERYSTLRSLFCIEFALATTLSESELREEWEETLQLLNSLDSTFVHSIIRNLMVPFLECLYIVSYTLLKWNSTVLKCEEKIVVKECQRYAEEELMKYNSIKKRNESVIKVRHPYSLSLDVYQSLLSSLVACRYVKLNDDKFLLVDTASSNKFEDVLTIVQDLLCSFNSSGSYLSLTLANSDSNLRAKL